MNHSNRAKQVNEKLRLKTTTIEISGLEFTIKAIDLLDMLDMSEQKIGVLNSAKAELGLKEFEAVPENLRDKYVERVAEISGKEYLKVINEKTIKEFATVLLPKAVLDPKIKIKPMEEVDPNKEVSIDLMLGNLDLTAELINQILNFSAENSTVYPNLKNELKAIAQG